MRHDMAYTIREHLGAAKAAEQNDPDFDIEPLENRLADTAIKVMREWMPENGTTYLESKMLWGRIWEEMRTKINTIR